MTPIVKTVHAHVGETVEIHWHDGDPIQGRPFEVLIERYVAPSKARWKDKAQPAPIEDDWIPGVI